MWKMNDTVRVIHRDPQVRGKCTNVRSQASRVKDGLCQEIGKQVGRRGFVQG